MDSTRASNVKAPSLKAKLARIALAALLVIGVVPACTLAQADVAVAASGSAAIEYIPEDAFTPEGFNWGINFTDVHVAKGFSEESNIAQFYPRDYEELAKPGDPGFAARIDRSTPKGSFALRYAGATHKGDVVDAVVTLADWNYVEPIMSNGATGWGEYYERGNYDTFQPGVFVNTSYQRPGSLIENFNFYTVGLTDLVVEVEFFYSGTNDPYEIKGHATCIDLDVGQKFGFGGATTLAQVVAENDFLSIDSENRLVTSPNYPCGGVDDPHGAISADPNDPLYKLGLVGAYFDTTGQRRGEPCELTFVTSWTGVDSTAQSFFAMTNEFLTVPNPKDDVTDIGKLKVTKTADKTEGVSLGDVVTYAVDVPVHERGVTCRNGYSYTDFEIVDVLPDEMRYVDGSGYLADSEGRLIEGAGEVVYEGHGDAASTENTVKFEFSRDYLAHSMRMQGEHYRFVFKAVLTEYPADGSLSVSNRAYAHVNSNGAYLSNSVETSLVPPKWHVDKTADAYEYEVGDVIGFTSIFTQTEKNAQCREAVFSDNLPEGMQLIPETVQATGLKNLPEPSINENRWSYSLDKFDYGDTLTVTYQAVALQSGNGTEQVNLSAAHANNCMDENDPAEVWTNTAKLDVRKTADYYEHYVGASDADAGVVEYTVVVENTKEGTIANNVTIRDVSLPGGMKIGRTNAGGLALDISGVPDTVAYPTAGSDRVHDETETRSVTCNVSPDGTGFSVAINHLPAHVPVTIAYRCYPEESVAGWEIENAATVTADNALPEDDTALIWVNQPTLDVEKTASLSQYTVGDFVTYHIKATNKTPGTLGRNLVISDLLHTEGVELQRDSIKIWDSDGNDITDSCTVRTNRNKPSFIVETHKNLVNDADTRTTWSFGEHEADGGNPLGIAGETAVYVDYAVAIADAALAGKTVDNTALAVVDEPNTKTTDDESVAVKGAKLRIQKSSDKAAYEIGDTARYELSVTQTREDVTAHGVALSDSFEDATCAEIDIDSIRLFDNEGVAAEPKSVTPQTDSEGRIVGFSLETGLDLADEEGLTITYNATMTEEREHVENRAQATADDAAGDSTRHDVAVTGRRAAATIEKEASPSTVHVGDTVSYTVTATMTEGTARNTVVSDKSLPDGMALDLNSISAEVNGNALDGALLHTTGNGLSLDLGTLSQGDCAKVSFTAVANDQALAGKRVVNNAMLSSPDLEADLMAQAIVEVKKEQEDPAPSATIEKEASTETASEGDTITYAISIDSGDADLEDAHVEDTGMPDGVSIDYGTFVLTVDGKASPATFERKEPNSFLLSLGRVPAKSQITIEYEATVEDASLVGDKVENSATLVSRSLADSPRAKTEVVVVPVPPSKTDAVITKSVDKETVSVGDELSYEIEVKAVGGAIENAQVNDTKMPEGAPIDFESISIEVDGERLDAPVESDGNTFSAAIGTLQEGSTATITFKASLEDESLEGTKFSNRATLSSPSLEDDRLAHAVVSVEADADPEQPASEQPDPEQQPGTKAKGTLGKTGDVVLSTAMKALPVVATLALAAGALALAKRAAQRRQRF